MRVEDVKEHGVLGDDSVDPTWSGRIVWRPWYWPFSEREILATWKCRKGTTLVHGLRFAGSMPVVEEVDAFVTVCQWHGRLERRLEARIRELRGETTDVPPVES